MFYLNTLASGREKEPGLIIMNNKKKTVVISHPWWILSTVTEPEQHIHTRYDKIPTQCELLYCFSHKPWILIKYANTVYCPFPKDLLSPTPHVDYNSCMRYTEPMDLSLRLCLFSFPSVTVQQAYALLKLIADDKRIVTSNGWSLLKLGVVSGI